MRAPLVIRRALGAPRDTERVARALRDAGEPVGSALSAALRDDRWGVVLVAERRGEPEGVAVLRFLAPVGASPQDAPARALLDGVYADDPEVREALASAARAEAEARELPLPEAPAPAGTRAQTLAPQGETSRLALAEGVFLELVDDPASPLLETRWSGALAFRARWREDLARAGWSVEGCIGADDDEGDALRFDRATRALREVYLRQPARVLRDPDALARVRAVSTRRGRIRLADGVATFALPRTHVTLFDVSLDVLAALREDAGEGPLTAVAVTDALSLLFVDGVYAGWRVTDPIAHARPMGWPDVQSGAAPSRREALTALVHDWMVIDAGPRVRPDEVTDPEEIEHMVALRARARELAAHGEEGDPTPGVARDIGAHIHWSWGFFRVPEAER